MIVPEHKWIIEWISPYEAHMHGVKKVYYVGRTKYQAVAIVETYSLGKALFLDGYIQSSAYDEFVYHESLVHPAMIAHGEPRSVLILGGGEGATAREVLKHPTVERVVMVDLDGELVELCKKYMPEWNAGAFEDPKLELVIGEGRAFLEKCREKFDVIILDLTDPVAGTPSVLLYTVEFYKLVKERLREGGIMVTQATSMRYYLNVFATIRNTIARVFSITRAYRVFVPSFVSEWGFVTGSDSKDPLTLTREEFEKAVARLKGELRFYDWEAHRNMFWIPKHIAKRVAQIKDVSTDAKPVALPPL